MNMRDLIKQILNEYVEKTETYKQIGDQIFTPITNDKKYGKDIKPFIIKDGTEWTRNGDIIYTDYNNSNIIFKCKVGYGLYTFVYKDVFYESTHLNDNLNKFFCNPSKFNNNEITGDNWVSCKNYKNYDRNNIKIVKSKNSFYLNYMGPISGVSIAHAKNGKGDTIHQIYNVLICEINPFLSKGNMKPDINKIIIESNEQPNKDYTLTITVPLEDCDETYQLDRRGGWGHNPGNTLMDSKCKDINSKGGECFGPVQNVLNASFGKITEYFITYQI